MAKADYDRDCLVGGETTTPGPVCPNDWQPSAECNDGTRDVSGSEYDYLGHFRQAKYLRQGHNDLVGGMIGSGVGPAIDQNLLSKGLTAASITQQQQRAGPKTRALVGSLLGGGTNSGDYGGGGDDYGGGGDYEP
jgi:hypothetical protein